MTPPPTRSRLRRWAAGVATYDFSPAFSAKVRRTLYNPLGILLVAALVSFLCGFFLHAQGFVLAGGIAAVVGLGVVWPWLSLRELAGALAFDRARTAEGEAVGVRLTLRNRLPWAAWGLAVRDGFGGDGSQPAAAIASTPGRRTAVCRWSFTPARRGGDPLAAPRLTTGFPFGLWENSRRLAVDVRLVVWPKTFPVGPVPPVSGDRQVEGNVSRSKVGTTRRRAGRAPVPPGRLAAAHPLGVVGQARPAHRLRTPVE